MGICISDPTRIYAVPDVKLPPDTLLYGMECRGRYDRGSRNLMELPHEGMAAGFDLDFVHRENWANYGNRSVTFEKEDSQDYFILSGVLRHGRLRYSLSPIEKNEVSWGASTRETDR